MAECMGTKQMDYATVESDTNMTEIVNLTQCPQDACGNVHAKLNGPIADGVMLDRKIIPPAPVFARIGECGTSTGDSQQHMASGGVLDKFGDKRMGFGSVHFQPMTSSNAWKRPAHVRVNDDDLKIVSTNGHSLIFDAAAYKANKENLNKGLVGKIIGWKLPLHILDQELNRRWGHVGRFRTILLVGDCFLCIFESTEARDNILMGGPWKILGHIIGLDRWTPGFNPDKLIGLSSPIWIRLPKLPLLFWDNKTISCIGAMVGTPFWIDAQTTVLGCYEYAHVCVRMDLSKKLPTGIWIQDWIQDGSAEFFQPIVYVGISLLCFHCGIVGHKAEFYPCSKEASVARSGGVTCPDSDIPITRNESRTMERGESSGTAHYDKINSANLHKTAAPQPSAMVYQLGNRTGKEQYGPWTLVTRRKRPQRPAIKNQPPNFSDNGRPFGRLLPSQPPDPPSNEVLMGTNHATDQNLSKP